MLAADKNGIVCDSCGMNVVEKFTYFSFDAKVATVSNNAISFAHAAAPTYSFDICQRCMEEIKATIIRCYKPSRIVDNRSCPQGLFCDLSGVHMNGNFTCYYICVSIVVVDIHSKPSTTVTDDKYLELWVSDDAFAQLKNKAVAVQNNKGNKEWSSQAIQTK